MAAGRHVAWAGSRASLIRPSRRGDCVECGSTALPLLLISLSFVSAAAADDDDADAADAADASSGSVTVALVTAPPPRR